MSSNKFLLGGTIVGIVAGLGLSITNHDNAFEHWYFTFNYYFGVSIAIICSFLTAHYFKEVTKDAIEESLQQFQIKADN